MPAGERALFAVLLMRKTVRSSSPLMPCINAMLRESHHQIPSAWNPASADGATRRANLAAAKGGEMLLSAADQLR